ncbi:MAG: diacylglycerol kinase family lipid kinase [Nitrospiraceae bacterium]|nr:diacylglycerol kinase family lipid kinase [Nitrospiraceae bacterium]
MKRFKLIANPASGTKRTRRIASQVVELLGRKNVAFDLEFTNAPRHAAEIASRSCKDFDAIVAIGGDGTIHEVAGAMLSCEVPLGIIPAGSGNDLIKSLGIPTNIPAAVDVLLAGRSQVIDVGTINGLCFVNVVGIGFDAAVNHNSHGLRWPASGLLRYVIALVKTLGSYAPVPLAVTIDGETSSANLFLLTIGNGTTCGGGFRLTPHAKLDDGLLDVTRVKPITIPRLIWHLPKVINGTLDRVELYASMRTARKIRVESASPLPVHVDGEIYRGDTTRLEIEILPKALTVIGNI